MNREILCDGKPCLFPPTFSLAQLISRVIIEKKSTFDINQLDKYPIDAIAVLK